MGSTACSFATKYASEDTTCTVQCHDTIDVLLSTDHYNIIPDPAQSGGETEITFSARLFAFYTGAPAYDFSADEPFAPSSARNWTGKKKTVDLSASKSSMYALLQRQETPDQVLLDATVGFGVAEGAEVEEVQAE